MTKLRNDGCLETNNPVVAACFIGRDSIGFDAWVQKAGANFSVQLQGIVPKIPYKTPHLESHCSITRGELTPSSPA